MTVLAIDLAGRKLAAGLVAADGSVSGVSAVAAPADAEPEAVWDTVVTLAEGVVTAAGSPALQGIGVAVDSSFDQGWDVSLRDRLRARHPDLLVRTHAGARCFAAGEHWAGSGKGAEGLLAIVLDATVEGGLVLDGRLVHGGTGNAGGIGHVVVDPVGHVCACGGIGCLDAVARASAVLGWARGHGWIAGASAGAPELAASARAGDPVASAALALAGTAVGIAISSAAALLDVDLVVIGGGLAESGEILFGPIRRTVERHLAVPYGKRVEVLPTGLGRQAGLVGAAALLLA